MNDAVILLCGVILLLAVLPMILMSGAFKGAGGRKNGSGGDANPVLVDPGSSHGASKSKSGAGHDDSGSFSDGGADSGDGDGGGGGE